MTKKFPIKHKGNESLFLGLEMSLIAGAAGIPLHIHAEGLRGTGKTTIMRHAGDIMPVIRRIKGCLYQCDALNPHCPDHAGKKDTEFLTEEVKAPFLEIGHGAKLGTILGSVDLEKLTDPSKPFAALLPGSIPMAHRGVLFIDEINRLAETAPEITDVLLSLMGTKPGKIKIEEVGLAPWELEIQSSVWATSNPDEDPGPLEEIRRQLSDRFDLVIPVQRPQDPAVIESILKKKTSDDTVFPEDFRQKLSRFKNVTLPPEILFYMSNLYVKKNIESIRAIEALDLCSRLLAAIEGDIVVSFSHMATVIPLVLRHRVQPMVLSEILSELEEQRRKAAGTKDVEEVSAKKAVGDTVAKPDNVKTPAPVDDAQKEKKAGGAQNIVHHSAKKKTKPNWYRKLFQRFKGEGGKMAENQNSSQDGAGRESSENKTSSSKGEKSQGHVGNSKASPSLADPKTTPPKSPPKSARKIDTMPWEEVIYVPDWRDD